jgi:hypothetical protein
MSKIKLKYLKEHVYLNSKGGYSLTERALVGKFG